MLIGYARVSTLEQSLALQTDALIKAGCERIFDDKLSGAKDSRPGLAEALNIARSGDTLVIWKLDRLGRSAGHLINLADELKARDIQLWSLTDAINTSTASGKFFFGMMSCLAEMERSLTIERTRAGLEAARLRGNFGGRPRAMTVSKVASAKVMLASGIAPRDVASNLGVSIPTLYRWVPASD